MIFPALPFWLLLAGIALVSPVIGLARGPVEGRPWFPWFLLPLLFLPSLLQLLHLDFAGMLAVYLAWPATLGPLALLLPSLLRFLSWRDPFFWLFALGLALLWLGLIRRLWLRRQRLAAALWSLSVLFASLPLYLWLLPPD